MDLNDLDTRAAMLFGEIANEVKSQAKRINALANEAVESGIPAGVVHSVLKARLESSRAEAEGKNEKGETIVRVAVGMREAQPDEDECDCPACTLRRSLIAMLNSK